MLRSIRDLEGYTVSATDGAVGHVKDFYFDDETWVLRYFVVDTGEWLMSRRVLISPIAVGFPKWTNNSIPVSITREQVRNSPDIDTNKPVSRQHEIQYSGYYGYPYYWGGTGLWGQATHPGTMLSGVGHGDIDDEYKTLKAKQLAAADRRHPGDQHLRSCNAITKYRVHASDGNLGNVHDLLLDEETWSIRYLIVDTSNWWIGHRVLISPEWVADVSWLNEKVSLDLTRHAIKDAPPYDPMVQLDREHEFEIYQHYDRRGYWTEQATHEIGS